MPRRNELLPDFNWQTLLEKLRAPRPECALVLGEGAYAGPDGTLLRQVFREHLENTPYAPCLFPAEKDTDLLLLPDSERTDFCSGVRLFYEDQPAAESLNRLARIPFPLVINTAPHGQFAKAFSGLRATPQLFFYNRSEAPGGKIQPPGRNNPLVYNLLGAIEDDNSLVLTHNDLFDYFEAVFRERPLPEDLRLLLRGVRYFVFLGVPFGQWYFHLLLRILGIQNFTTANRHASAEGVAESDVDFAGDLFQIRFVRRNIGAFIDELHDRCAAENLLRSADAGVGSPLEAVEQQLRDDDPAGQGLDRATELLENYLREKADADSLRDLSVMSGNFRRARRKYDGKLITGEQFDVEINRSKLALLHFLDDIKTLHATRP